MIQEIIAILIIFSAFLYASIKIYKKVRNPLGKCEDCGSANCESCELQSLKEQIENNKNKQNNMRKADYNIEHHQKQNKEFK